MGETWGGGLRPYARAPLKIDGARLVPAAHWRYPGGWERDPSHPLLIGPDTGRQCRLTVAGSGPARVTGAGPAVPGVQRRRAARAARNDGGRGPHRCGWAPRGGGGEILSDDTRGGDILIDDTRGWNILIDDTRWRILNQCRRAARATGRGPGRLRRGAAVRGSAPGRPGNPRGGGAPGGAHGAHAAKCCRDQSTASESQRGPAVRRAGRGLHPRP